MHNASTPFPGVRPEWLARLPEEEVIAPELPIVDAHHHLWNRPDWRYMLDDLQADLASGHNIVSTVFVQCHAMHRASGEEAMRPVGETEFVNGVAAMSASGMYGPTRICEGIVGFADLRLGEDVGRVLDAHLARGGARFKGIRHILAWDADPLVRQPAFPSEHGLMGDARFRRGFAQLAPRGLSFDAYLFHTQLGDLVDLARAFPSTTIVLNHVGTPLAVGSYAHRRDDILRQWTSDMRQLAACENVVVKLGGLGMRPPLMGFTDPEVPMGSDALAQAMRPYVEPCIEFFGAQRCMFESNFPVDKVSFSYRSCWNTFKRLAAGASAEDTRALFHDTAARVYRLGASA